MAKRIRSVFQTFLTILLLTLIALEIVFRISFPSLMTYEDEIARSLLHPERIYQANRAVTYDIKGLYPDANEATVRVSENRFIEPEGDPSAQHQVLFLGGSTTEALYVPEPERWVALLNEPDIATYNAGMSGANTLDKYHTFQYFTDMGWTFDLVVIMTTMNDLGWLFRVNDYGYELRLDEYPLGLEAWYYDEVIAKRDWLDYLGQYSRVAQIFASYTDSLKPDGTIQGFALSAASKHYNFTGERVSLDDCARINGIPADELIDRYDTNARANLQLLADAVHATGARLLVLSEASSYLAPEESFTLRARAGFSCDENKMLTFEGADALTDIVAQRYLAAGCHVGALSYDLREAISPYTDGPNGGTYIYDEVHYTPAGSEQAAAILRPVLRDILAGNYVSPCES